MLYKALRAERVDQLGGAVGYESNAQKIAIFSRLMKYSYDETKKIFAPVCSLSETKKKLIATSVHMDIYELVNEFKKLKTPFSKALLGKEKEVEKENQDLLDSLLKVTVPIMWHYNDIFRQPDPTAMLPFIPEGVEDAAKITLNSGEDIMVWKEERKKSVLQSYNYFVLQWCPCNLDGKIFKKVPNSPFMALKGESIPLESSIKYECGDKKFNNMSECLTYLAR